MLCRMDVESRIGPTLARLRRQAGLSPEELAAIARVPVSTVVGVESGAMEPPTALVARLTAAVASRLREGRAR